MIVRNWMREEPTLVDSDTLVLEAKRILTRNNLRALPVVDEGRLRGIVTRASCLRASECVTRTQDPHELDFFVTRLKVKDIMVRNPETVEIDDTMEHTLFKGQEIGVSQFPVLDNEKVVGMVSASEVFYMAAQLLGAREDWSGITLDNVEIERGTLAKIAGVAEEAGATLHAVFPLSKEGARDKRVILRLETGDLGTVVSALGAAGFQVVESTLNVKESRKQ